MSNKTMNKPQTINDVAEYFNLLPRAKTRLAEAVGEEVVPLLTWNTLRCLAFACRDPRTTAKDITLSQKVMMYRRYDKLWASIAEATRLYGAKINDIKIQPDVGEDVSVFRTRYLKEILGL